MQLRALGLLSLMATQAVAGGLSSAIHLCSLETKRDSCRCKHKERQTAELDAFRKLACCTTSAVSAPAPEAAAAELRGQATHVAAPVALPVPVVLAAALPARAASAWLSSAPSQGPPIFLKVHALLN